MEITEVRILPATKAGKVKAFASIVIDNCFVVNDLRVIEARGGNLFVAMPSRKTRNGSSRDVAHPINTETRKLIEDKVIGAYKEAVRTRALPSAKKGKQSVMDKLASRLLSEDYWLGQGQPE